MRARLRQRLFTFGQLRFATGRQCRFAFHPRGQRGHRLCVLLAATPFAFQFRTQRIEATTQLAGIDLGETMLFAFAVQLPLQIV